MKNVLNKLKMRLPVIIMLVVSFLYWPNYDPCIPDGPMQLGSLTLSDASSVQGDCKVSGSSFILNMKEGGVNPSIRFPISDISGFKIIRLTGRMRGENVVPGKYDFNSARLVLLQYDAAGRSVGCFDGQAYGTGTFGWSRCLTDYWVRRGVERAEVVLEMGGRSGTACFDSIEAQPVKQRRGTLRRKAGFALAWFALGIFYFPRCRLHKRKLRHLILLNVLVILIGVLLPGRWLQEGLYRMSQIVNVEQRDAPPLAGQQPVIKQQFITAGFSASISTHFEETVGHATGHYILFASLSFLVLLSGALEGQPNSYYPKVAFDMLLFGAVTEALQFLTPDRTVDMTDMLCNAYGMLTAMGVFIVLRIFRRNSVQWMAGKTN